MERYVRCVEQEEWVKTQIAHCHRPLFELVLDGNVDAFAAAYEELGRPELGKSLFPLALHAVARNNAALLLKFAEITDSVKWKRVLVAMHRVPFYRDLRPQRKQDMTLSEVAVCCCSWECFDVLAKVVPVAVSQDALGRQDLCERLWCDVDIADLDALLHRRRALRSRAVFCTDCPSYRVLNTTTINHIRWLKAMVIADQLDPPRRFCETLFHHLLVGSRYQGCDEVVDSLLTEFPDTLQAKFPNIRVGDMASVLMQHLALHCRVDEKKEGEESK